MPDSNHSANWQPFHYVTLGLAAVVFIAALLPWAKASAGIFSATKAGTEGDGVITLIIALVLAGVILAGVFSYLRPVPVFALTLCAGLGVSAVGIYDWADLNRIAAEARSSEISVSVTVQSGLVLTTVAGIAIVLWSVISWTRSRAASTSTTLPEESNQQ